MKKLVFLFLSLLAFGSFFQACDNSKTYAEMLEDEKNAVNNFIKDSAFHIISLDEFEKDTITKAKANGDAYDEFVAFSNGVYMQIINRGSKIETDTFANNNEICVRYLEKDVATGTITSLNIFLPEYSNNPQIYAYPAVFRYTVSGSSAYATFIELDYAWNYAYQGATDVPSGWLLAMPYIRNDAYVRFIIPSKMGHTTSQNQVVPFYYELRELSKAKS